MPNSNAPIPQHSRWPGQRSSSATTGPSQSSQDRDRQSTPFDQQPPGLLRPERVHRVYRRPRALSHQSHRIAVSKVSGEEETGSSFEHTWSYEEGNPPSLPQSPNRVLPSYGTTSPRKRSIAETSSSLTQTSSMGQSYDSSQRPPASLPTFTTGFASSLKERKSQKSSARAVHHKQTQNADTNPPDTGEGA